MSQRHKSAFHHVEHHFWHAVGISVLGAFLSLSLLSGWPAPLFQGVSAAVDWGTCSTQSGTAAIPASSDSINVTLTNSLADTGKAFLLFDITGNSTIRSGENHMVSGYIVDNNTVVFEREGEPNAPVYISYNVIECEGSLISVQRGEIDIDDDEDSNTASITSVDTTRAVVFVNSKTDDDDNAENEALVTGELQNSTTVLVERADDDDSETTVRFEVVEFGASSGVTVQTGEVELDENMSSVTDTISAVDPTRSWIYCSWDAEDNGLRQTAVGCELTDSTTVTFHRYNQHDAKNRIRYYVIEFPEDTVTVQRGNTYNDPPNQNNVEYSHDIPITPVSDLTKAFHFVTNTTNGSGTAFPRNQWKSELVDESTLRMTFWRGANSVDRNYKYWQVVEFPEESVNVSLPSGGISPTDLPARRFISLNDGAECTPSRTIPLGIKAENTSELLISNNPQFMGAEWQNFNEPSEVIEWELEGGDGDKIVYMLFRNHNLHTSTIMYESIELDETTFCGGLSPAARLQAAVLHDENNVCSIGKRVKGYLIYGIESEEIERMQYLLRCLGYFPPEVDVTGYFGGTTEESVKDFQEAHELEVTGVVEYFTRAALNEYYVR